jgi:hypothetical protein
MLLCAAALPGVALDGANRSTPRVAIRAVLVAATLAISLRVLAVALIPSYLISQAEETLDSAGPAEPLVAYLAARRLPGVAYDASRALAILEANAGRFDDAEHHVERALRGLDTGDIHYLAGYIAEKRNDPARAAHEYGACNARWPDHVRAWEGRLRLAAEEERDALLASALPWLDVARAERLRGLREQLRTAQVQPSGGAVP